MAGDEGSGWPPDGTSCGKLGKFGGAVAQLGARLDGIEEVVGSNPIGSTILFNHMRLWRGLYDMICVAFCALAHLQLGRAYAMQGDTAKAEAADQDFLTLWKDPDPDISSVCC
jgi:hypothetical protein